MKDDTQATKPCAPDYDISSIQEVTIDENAKHISNEIETLVNMPIEKYSKWSDNVSINEILGAGSRKLNDIKPTDPGHRRIICTDDGHTAVEEILENIPQQYFSYKVWNYSSKFFAERIEYAKGEFWYNPRENKTHIRWRYSFKISDEKYRQEFESFIAGFWNNWMINILNNMKALAEKEI